MGVSVNFAGFFAMMFSLVLTSLLVATAPPGHSFVYVSAAGDGRIKVFERNVNDGSLNLLHTIVAEGRPGPLCVNPDQKYLFASLRELGQLASFRLNAKNGDLKLINTVEVGKDPAFVATDKSGKFLLSAYYRAGAAAIHPIRPNGRLDKAQQWVATAPNAHAIQTDASNHFAYVPHTGPNAIYQFVFDAEHGALRPNEPAVVSTGANTGPRHLAFHPALDVIYFDNEQGSSVTAYTWNKEKGTLKAAGTVTTLPKDFKETNSCSHIEISPDGKFVYCANRGHDSLARFAVDEKTGALTALGQTPTEKTPRSFNLAPSGDFLYAAGQSSGKLASYRVNTKTGDLEPLKTYDIGDQPWWVMVVDFP